MPTITFQLNLETPLRESHAPVNNLRGESDHLKSTRVSWLPDLLRNNRELKDGDQFTVKGEQAQYLKDNYTTGDYAPLTVVSEGLVFSEEGE